ncbi:MAG: ShlB/FhaC/HecB family hemolysin secretion/activation protein [Alphaproteobacteria bacterium]|nr:ShlB/FhaC/HecB family hemolysin secretion/activation protein [Alphaproteobacteria bacterium]
MLRTIRGSKSSLHRVRSLSALPVLGLIVMGATLSQSYAAVEVPSTAQPGQIEKRMAPSKEPTSRIQLTVPPPVESQRIPEALRKKLEANKFALQKVIIEGATVYTAEDLSFAYVDQIGKTISLLDARSIAMRITNYYRNNGYILTQAVIPTQEIANGTLKVRVIEGYISNISYEGDIGDDREHERLAGYTAGIKNSRPARMADLERYMLLMNDLPGSTITGLIRPSNVEFGSADLILTVRRKRLEASYTFDNRGSKYIGPWQHTFVVGANSILTSYDHTQARFMTANPWKELFLAELQHDEILDSEGTRITLLASHTYTNPGDDLKPLDIKGRSNLVSAKISRPFLRSRQQSLVGRFQFDIHNTAIDVISGTELIRDRVRVLRAGTTYNFLDSFLGSDSFDLQLSQGLNIFDATDEGSNRSSPNAESAFTKVNFDASRLQPLPDGFSILTSATGQYSFESLMTDEQFSFGGSDFGRAFDPSEALGDSGLGGKIEFRYDELVDEPYLESYQIYTSFDIEEAWKRATPAGTDTASTSLASWALGTRFRLTENFSGTLELDVPLMGPDNSQSDYRDSPRIFFSITARY